MTSSTKNKTPKDLKPLIDGDVLVYRCGFAADGKMKRDLKKQYGDSCPMTVQEMLNDEDYVHHALQNTKTVIESVLDRFSEEYKLYLHHSGNFREQVATLKGYKANRSDAGKPKYYNEIKEYLFDHWNAIPVRGMESDDAIGLEQFDNPDKYTVIVSIDKDMDLIPGWHYNWVKSHLYYQNITDSNLQFFWQMMVGDSTDNIPGIKNVGEKTAGKILNECDRDVARVRTAVQELYASQYGPGWEAAYTEVGTLLWILRKPEQLQNGPPILW